MSEDDLSKPNSRYKEGNTAPDGSYIVGKGRTSQSTRFATGDGRRRGRREKGTKNLGTDFAEELAERIAISEAGKTRKHSKQRAMIRRLVERALKGDVRAAELVFRHLAALPERAPTLCKSDREAIAEWMAQQSSAPTGDPDTRSSDVQDGRAGSGDY